MSGRYWHDFMQEEPAREATDPAFQDELIGKLSDLAGLELP